ncbi:HAD family acid phosphatase, partial [Streptomyces massasporeus]
MHKPLRIAAIAAACAVAGAGLYGAGAATAGQSTANSTHEPYNIGVLVKDIDTYYGTTADADGVYQASPDSPYAKDLARLGSAARTYIDQAARKARHKGEKPAVVFDIDDTLLLSLDYEKRYNYTYNATTWADYVNRADRPAVFGSPQLVRYAAKKGVEVFYNSGLSEAQRSAAVENLKKVGVGVEHVAGPLLLKAKADTPGDQSASATPGPGDR